MIIYFTIQGDTMLSTNYWASHYLIMTYWKASLRFWVILILFQNLSSLGQHKLILAILGLRFMKMSHLGYVNPILTYLKTLLRYRVLLMSFFRPFWYQAHRKAIELVRPKATLIITNLEYGWLAYKLKF